MVCWFIGLLLFNLELNSWMLFVVGLSKLSILWSKVVFLFFELLSKLMICFVLMCRFRL